MSRVRELSKVILQKPKYLRLNEERAGTVAYLLQDQELTLPTWDFAPFYPQSDDFEEMCLFYLLFNSINYCYFDQDGKKFTDGEFSGSTLAGLRLTERWKELQDPTFLAHVDENYLLSELFAAESPISMVKERTHAFREIGVFLNKNPDFTFAKLFRKYHGNAYLVSQVIPSLLPTWRDPFFKRAQLFLGMVYGKFQNAEDPYIKEETLEDLTVFADYRLPQTLIAMGIIEPRASLLTRLHQNQFIGSGSRKELEIRAATILGTDMLTAALGELLGDINVLHTDYLLWRATRIKDQLPPEVFSRPWPNHHLTMSTDY